MRTLASILASDMADRIRVNSTQALDTDNYIHTLGANTSGTATACEDNACSSSELAAYDYKQWDDQLVALLPGGEGQISASNKNAAGWREYTIVIQFNSISTDKSASSTPDTSSFTYRTRI